MAVCIFLESFAGLSFFLILILQRQALIRGQPPFLPGSCIAAGHTECCHDGGGGCMGEPPTCSCDPSCREFGDCCSDFALICNPEQDAALELLRPAVTFVQRLTFHTASLCWILPDAAADSEFIFNGSYNVVLEKAPESVSSTEQNVSHSIRISSPVGRREYVLRLDGLDEDAHYQFSISIVTSVKILENVAQGTFATLRYPSIAKLKLEVEASSSNSSSDSSVRVRWLPPAVPVGVSLHGFKVYYHHHTLAGDNETNGAQMVQTAEPDATIRGLTPDRLYRFEVVGVYLEADGTLYKGRREGNSSEIFVAGSSIFQLVAKLSIECQEWQMQYAADVLASFNTEVVNSIQSSCNCSYPKKNLHEETLMPLCIDSEDEPFIQVTYRARLFGMNGHTADKLIGHVDARRRSNQAIPLQINHTLSRMVLISAESCSTRLEFKSASLCGVETATPAAQTQPPQTEPPGVSRKTLITALVAEFVSVTTLFLLVALATTCFMVARRRWQSSKVKNVESESTVENLYSTFRERQSKEDGGGGGNGGGGLTANMDACSSQCSSLCLSPPSYNQVMGSPQTKSVHHKTQNWDDNEPVQDVKDIL